MKRTIIFVTGTDTSVGKTVVAALLARHFHRASLPVAALKPICSGGRADAVALRNAQDGALTLDDINPWHFRAPLAPLLAARLENRKLNLKDVLAHVRRLQNRFPVVLVE